MYVERLRLENYRCFDVFDMAFDEKLTVIVARNGQGKTTVLDGITIALGTFVAAFDHGKGLGIEPSDARLLRLAQMPNQEHQVPVVISAHFQGVEGVVRRELAGVKRHKTTTKDAKAIADLGVDLMQRVRLGESVDLPIVAFYGSGRLWVTHREKKTEKSRAVTASRTKGYEDCLSRASNFKQLQDWMKIAEMAVLQKTQGGDSPGALGAQLSAIKSAVDVVLESQGWSRFHYNLALECLAMRPLKEVTQHAMGSFDYLPVGQLSDGIRAVVSLVADLAWRCTILNPHLGESAPAKTSGIVMVDEIDLHLHPAWQQTIIGSLRTAFPEVQFILTTHSPQVLSTVASDQIRVIEGGQPFDASPGTQGAESSRILERVFGVESRPPQDTNTKMLNAYLELVFDDQWGSEQAVELRGELDAIFQGEEPELTRAEEYIANRTWELGLEEDS